MVTSFSELEVLVRALGLPYQKREQNLLLEYRDEKYGRIGLVVSYLHEANTIRFAAPLDVEPLEQALQWFLRSSFESYSYKYTVDYEGFITVVYDLPRKCVNTVADVREAILEVLEGARKVLERTETRES